MELVSIKDFPKYKVDENGNVYSYQRKKIIKLKYKEDKDGYLEVGLWKNGKKYCKRVHRIVAETFIPNYENKPQIDHINRDKKDNRVSNLRWATCKENSQHAVDIGLSTYTHCEKAVLQIDLSTGCVIREFKSLQEAETITKVARQNISKVARGLRTKAGNFGWQYK